MKNQPVKSLWMPEEYRGLTPAQIKRLKQIGNRKLPVSNCKNTGISQ